MLDRDQILTRVPHAGQSCLLERMTHVSDTDIRCTVVAHLDPANPLRSRGRLSAVCGVEMGLQAAALHAAVRGAKGGARPGYLASLRDVSLHMPYLDKPAFGDLEACATMMAHDPSALFYSFSIRCAAGTVLLEGRATVVLAAVA